VLQSYWLRVKAVDVLGIDMMLATRRQLLTGAAGAALAGGAPAALLHAQAIAPPDPGAEITISINDASVGSGDRTARVPVTLSAPTNRTIVVEYATQNGAGTYGALPGKKEAGSAYFIVARGQLIFQPGEQKKLIEVELLRQLNNGQSIILHIADFGFPLRNKYINRIGQISSSDTSSIGLAGSDLVQLPSLPTGGSVVFSDNLLASDFASDSGFRSDGKPCWQSRLANGRQQDGNKELGYYADPALNPEAAVWGVDPSTGRRFIQAEYLEGGLSDRNGGKLSPGWQKDIPFSYSAAIVTSRTLFNRITLGSYVEFEVKLARVAGSWPALWLLPANDAWPPEIDVLEVFINSPGHAANVVTSSIHWRGAGGHRSYGAEVPLTQFEPDADIFSRFNRFGCYVGERQIVYYFNDRPYCAMPNLAGEGPWYMLMDVAVGGLEGQPSDPKAFPARMYIANVKVIQFP
jgi:Glycosyl hydrolases family 16